MMLKITIQSCKGYALLLFATLFLTSCITAKKIDKYISSQYGNQLPKLSKTNNDKISITSSVPAPFSTVSNTITTTVHFLPLLFYWQGDHKHISTLNPGIFVNKFSNSISGEAKRRLASKLGDKKLTLTITQLPHVFTLGDKWHMVWVILYLIHWDKTYVKPDADNLVIDYKLLQGDQVVKSGTLSIPDDQRMNRLGVFQSWKNATSSYLSVYNYEIAKMSHACVDQLAKAL